MAPKNITVSLQDGSGRSLVIVDQSNLDKWLEEKLQVQSLVDNQNVEYDVFDLLVDGGSYTLGPSMQQQQNVMENLEKVVTYVTSKMAEEETLIMSDAKTDRFNKAMLHFNLKKDAAEWTDKPDLDPSGQPHTWLSSKEDSQENRLAYMAYLREPNNITLPPGTTLYEGSSDKHLLSVEFSGFGNMKTSGNVDVVLADSRHQNIATVRQNILVGIELKKDDNKEHAKIERQATLQHFSASYLNDDAGILTLMTDLKNRWHFFWFTKGKRLLRYEANRSEAKYLIQHSQAPEGKISAPTSFLNRACWRDLFSSRLDAIAEVTSFEETYEGGEDREPSGGNSAGNGLADRGGQSIAQQSSSRSSARTPNCGKSRGAEGGGRVRAQMGDTSMEYMDEEERLEETFRVALQSSFHKLMYVPEVKERHALPREIRFAASSPQHQCADHEAVLPTI